MKLLNQIQTGRQPRPRRVMLYGTHGIGKSTFGSMAEKPVFIQTDADAPEETTEPTTEPQTPTPQRTGACSGRGNVRPPVHGG